MIEINDVRQGMAIEIDGELYICQKYEHYKPGKGPAFVKLVLKNLRTGAQAERKFNTDEKVKKAFLDSRPAQFMYHDVHYNFMDQESYETLTLDESLLGDNIDFLEEGMVIIIVFYEGTPVGAELPNFVELEVAETDPGLKGDTASGGSKPAKLSSGAMIQVPLFVNIGDRIRVDTRKREYVTRVS